MQNGYILLHKASLSNVLKTPCTALSFSLTANKLREEPWRRGRAKILKKKFQDRTLRLVVGVRIYPAGLQHDRGVKCSLFALIFFRDLPIFEGREIC